MPPARAIRIDLSDEAYTALEDAAARIRRAHRVAVLLGAVSGFVGGLLAGAL